MQILTSLYQFINQSTTIWHNSFAFWCFFLTACHNADIAPVRYERASVAGSMSSKSLKEKAFPSTEPSSLKPSSKSNREQFVGARVPIPELPGVTNQPWHTLQVRLEHEPNLACEISYKQTAAAIPDAPLTVDTGTFPPIELAPYEVFMNDCLKLPQIIQKCQVFRYTIRHHATCIVARRKYDTEIQVIAIEHRRTLVK